MAPAQGPFLFGMRDSVAPFASILPRQQRDQMEMSMRLKTKRKDNGVVELDVTVTAKEVDSIISQTQEGIIRQLELRSDGKTPLEQLAKEQAGIDNLEERIAQGAVEAMISLAIDQSGIVPAAYPPARQKAPLQQGKLFSFTIEVKPKPAYELSSYEPVEISLPKLDLSEESLDAKCLETLRQTKVHEGAQAHPLAEGDSALLKVHASVEGVELKGLCTGERGLHYQLGSGMMPQGFDEAIMGMEPGQSKEFAFEAPDFDEKGNPRQISVDCQVTVLECQQEAQPQMNDEWIARYMPFYRSVADLRQMVRQSMEREARAQQTALGCRAAAAELAKRFEGHIDDDIYESMQKTVFSRITQQLQEQGKSFEEYAQEVGEQMANMQVMMETRQALREGFALDAVFRHEGLELTEEDMEFWCREMYPDKEPRQTRLAMERSGQGFMMKEAASRLKANRWVYEHAHITWEEER